MKYPATVTLIGATGLVGGELLKILSSIQEIHSVKAVTRRPLGKIPPRTENLLLDLNKMGQYQELLKSDIFICCLGTTIKMAGSQEAFRKVDFNYVIEFAKIAEATGAQKLLVISALGADSKSRFFYNRVKGEMQDALRSLKIPQIEIFQPSLIMGERAQKRAGENFFIQIAPVLNKILIGSLKKYRSIEASDIAKAMTIAALDFHPGYHVYDSAKIQFIVDDAKMQLLK